MREVIAILGSDWHLREDRPVCRTDDYWVAQQRKIRRVLALQDEHDCPIIHAGDLFEHWKPSPFLLSFFMQEFLEAGPFYTIYGNHDLPQHNLDLAYKSGIATLEQAGFVEVLDGVHWGQVDDLSQRLDDYLIEVEGRQLLVWHVMTWLGERPHPNSTDPSADHLLRQHPEADLILTGHNHQPFYYAEAHRAILNPGSLMRCKADQVDHEPSVYLWYDDNSVEQVVLPYEPGVVSREHIEAREAGDSRRYQAFIEQLQERAPEISFRANLERFLNEHPTSKPVRDLVWASIEERP